MITLELLRNYNTKSISHRDFPSVQCLTRISLNFLYFTYTHKNQSDAEYFLNYLENLHFSKSINRIDMLLATIRYRDRKNLPTWQRRLLESFKLLNYQLENFTTTEESASFFANIFHAIEDCLCTTFLIIKKDPNATTDIVCNIGRYIQLYRDYSILSPEVLASALLKNLILQLNGNLPATVSVEIFPKISVAVCTFQPTQLSSEYHLNEKNLRVLMERGEGFLNQADFIASIARSATSLAEFLLAAKTSQFLYQVALLVLEYIVWESERQKLNIDSDIYHEIQITEENRVEIALLLKNDCHNLLFEPIVSPYNRAREVLYSKQTGQALPNSGYVDVREFVKAGCFRNPVYPSILINEWTKVLKVLDELDIHAPINFGEANGNASANLHYLLFDGMEKRFRNVFSDTSVASVLLSQMGKWSPPIGSLNMLLEHEGEHLNQNDFWKDNAQS